MRAITSRTSKTPSGRAASAEGQPDLRQRAVPRGAGVRSYLIYLEANQKFSNRLHKYTVLYTLCS